MTQKSVQATVVGRLAEQVRAVTVLGVDPPVVGDPRRTLEFARAGLHPLQSDRPGLVCPGDVVEVRVRHDDRVALERSVGSIIARPSASYGVSGRVNRIRTG